MAAERRIRGHRLRAMLALLMLGLAPAAQAQDQPEYRLKAAFLYNFAAFTEWPADVGAVLNLCIHGTDPFGGEIEPLQGKKVGSRQLAVVRKTGLEALKECHIVFVSAGAVGGVQRVAEVLRGLPVLTVADAAGALKLGAVLNMNVTQGRITFEANLVAARAARLNLSSKLLRLATEVIQ